MKIVIQCAAKKYAYAGSMKNSDGKDIMFIANPDLIESKNNYIYQKPDDLAEDGLNWRKKLLQYNEQDSNPLNLLPAYKLYMNGAYKKLVDKYGASNIFILSAGWGLINADFLIPNYDITFSSSADKYKRRQKSDNYHDFCFLPSDTSDDLIFLGGKDYLPLFANLTERYSGKRIVFYNSKYSPMLERCELIYYNSTTRTNWHYECAKKIINGDIDL